jgi:hypothetical protein
VPYQPQPIDISQVALDPSLLELAESLARSAHDIWARQRLLDGWKLGPERNDQRKETPCLVPYEELPESEKEYDRQQVLHALKAIVALGYRIEKAK